MRFLEGFFWGVVSTVVFLGLSIGTFSWADGILIIAGAAWPWAAHYYSQFSGLFGLVLRMYAWAPLFVSPLAILSWFFWR
jgi:hypothetical protein